MTIRSETNPNVRSARPFPAFLVSFFLVSVFLSPGFFPLSLIPNDLYAQSIIKLKPNLWMRDVSVDQKGIAWMSLDREGILILDPGSDPKNLTDNRWARMNRKNSGLPNDDVPAAAPEGERGIWFGTLVGGLAYMDHGNTPLDFTDDQWAEYTPETTQQGLPDPFIYCISVHTGGMKWIGTQKGGLCCLDDNHTPLTLSDDRWAVFDEKGAPAGSWIFRIVSEGASSRWLATWGNGLFFMEDNGTPLEKGDDRWVRFSEQDGLAGDKVRAAAREGTAGIWIASLGGFAYLDFAGTPFEKGDDRWIRFSPEDGLPGINVMDVALGPEGKKWIALWGGGLARLDDKGTPLDKTDDVWTLYGGAQGLTEQIVRRLYLDTKGLLWIATWGDGLLLK